MSGPTDHDLDVLIQQRLTAMTNEWHAPKAVTVTPGRRRQAAIIAYATAVIAAVVAIITIGLAPRLAPANNVVKPQPTMITSPSGTPSATPSLVAIAPTVAPSPGQLVAVAKRFLAPNGITCDFGPAAGAQHYAQCPFTPDLVARYLAYAPSGHVTGPAAGGFAFLCHCQMFFPADTYTATPSGAGGTVVINVPHQGGAPAVFTLTIESVNGELLISDITITFSACHNVHLDACNS